VFITTELKLHFVMGLSLLTCSDIGKVLLKVPVFC